jgi:group I intron endonuclease
MAYIYKITNIKNGKMYIGATTNTIEQRMMNHFRERNNKRAINRPLYYALNKYGIENFTHEIIEECNDYIRFEREIYWISFYDSTHCGYNMTHGGAGKPIFKYQDIINYMQTETSMRKVAEHFGCCLDIVIKLKKQAGFTHMLEDYDIFHKAQCRAVIGINQEDKIQKIFDSMQQASIYCKENGFANGNLSGMRSHISEVCKGKRKVAYGHEWKYL